MSPFDDDQPLNRRGLLKAGASVGAASLAFSALAARADNGNGKSQGKGRRPASPDYGPLAPVADKATGLYLLALPEGFEYCSYGWTGQIMGDGRATPTDHDGMACVERRGNLLCLVRNHELSAGESTQALAPGGTYNNNEYGGATNLVFDMRKGEFVDSYTSLGGTIRNCAGGPTPWNSWISCEETFHDFGNRADGFNHGYIFDVPGFGVSNGLPVRAAGRFSHEAVAVDPKTGVVYETEDAGSSAFYKYVQPGAGHANWRGGRDRRELLRDNGALFAMVVKGAPRMDLRGAIPVGATFDVEWQAVPDPDAKVERCFDQADQAAIISRGEGCWEDDGKIYFVSTDGGAAELGQVWVLDPATDKLTLLYASASPGDVDGPDNIALSPRGGIILCEDGDSDPKRLVGLTQAGEIFTFAENRIVLNPGDIDIIDAVFPGTKANFWDNVEGNFTSREWAGATMYGEWLFANVQSPGVTFAIRGPWERGAL